MEPVVSTSTLGEEPDAAAAGSTTASVDHRREGVVNEVAGEPVQQPNQPAGLPSTKNNYTPSKEISHHLDLGDAREKIQHNQANHPGNPEGHQDPPLISRETKQPPLLDSQKIDKAKAFLRNPEIHDVPTSAKRSYLQSKIGMTQDEIDMALKRAAAPESMGPDISRNINMERGYLRGSLSDQTDRRNEGEYNEYGYDRRPRARNPDQYYDERDRYERDQSPRHDNSMHPRRNSVHDARGYSQPQHDSGYGNNMSPYNQHPDPMEELSPGTSFFSLPAWAGGFSLGVFCLAALRWLNGGDFILFPPPTASEHHGMKHRHRIALDDEDENTDDASDSQQHDDIEEEDRMENHLNSEIISDIISDDNDDEDEIVIEPTGEDDADEDINMILNGTTDAQKFHPTPSQPSYEELVSEIQSLSSIIHSFRDAQERANKAVTAKVGKDVTDDVMDFLRTKKSEEQEKVNDERDQAIEEAMKAVCSLLNKAMEELSQLKSTASKEDKTDSVDNSTTNVKCTDGNQNELDDDKDIPGEDNASKRVDSVLAKIQDVLSIIQKTHPRQEETSLEEEVGEDDTKSKNDTKTPDLNEESLQAPETHSPIVEDGCDASEPASSTSPEPVPEKEHDASKKDDLEESIKVLSNSNDPQALKVGAQMLYLYCLNISKNPTVPRYRKIYTNNKNFQSKVANLAGAKEFLMAIGFAERNNFFEWSQSGDGSTDIKSKLDFALVALEMLKNGPKPDEEGNASSEIKGNHLIETGLLSSAAPLANAATMISGAGKNA